MGEPFRAGPDTGIEAPANPTLPRAALFGLSRREYQVALLAARGLSENEIGLALGVSYHTVDTHIRHACAKFEVETKADLALHFVVRLARYRSITLARSNHSRQCGCSVCFLRSRRRKQDAAASRVMLRRMDAA